MKRLRPLCLLCALALVFASCADEAAVTFDLQRDLNLVLKTENKNWDEFNKILIDNIINDPRCDLSTVMLFVIEADSWNSTFYSYTQTEDSRILNHIEERTGIKAKVWEGPSADEGRAERWMILHSGFSEAIGAVTTKDEVIFDGSFHLLLNGNEHILGGTFNFFQRDGFTYFNDLKLDYYVPQED